MDHPMEFDQQNFPQPAPELPPPEPPHWVAQFMEIMSNFSRTNTIPAPQPSSSSSGSTNTQSEAFQRKPRHSQRDPETFSNKDNSQYPQFRSFLEAKLRIDAKAIGSEEERVWYGFGCLSEDAAKRIHPWIQYAKDTNQFTVQGLLEQMDQAFADPQKRAKALNKINRIRQGNRDFRTFLQEFEQTLLEAQGWGWADDVKKGYLKSGLNRELRDRLVTQIEPQQYTDYTALLRMISDNLQEIKEWDARKNRMQKANGYYSSDSTATQPIGEAMDWEPAQPTHVASTGRAFQGQVKQDQKRANWVSRDEIGRRMAEGNCIRCGGAGHMIRDCSLLPALNPDRQLQNRNQPRKNRKPQVAASMPSKAKTTTATVIEEVENWETDDDETGKE